MLKELICAHLDTKKRESNYSERDKISFSPSSLNTCGRALYYKYTDTPASNEVSTHAYLKMLMGTTIHAEIEKILKEIGIYESGEELKEKNLFSLNFRYMVDGVLRINEKRYIFELKTVYASGYNSIEREPKIEHVMQLLSYMHLEKIDNGILLYIGRDNGYMIEYNLVIEDGNLYINHYEKNNYLEEFNGLIIKLKDIEKHIETEILPARDYQIVMKNTKGEISEKFTKDKVNYKSDWQCSYCKWKDLCWEKELKEINNNKFYIGGKFYGEKAGL